MSTYTLAPNGHSGMGGAAVWSATGGTTPGVLSDASDTTYVFNKPGTTWQLLDFSTVSIPAGEVIVTVAATLRAKASTAGCTLSVANRSSGVMGVATRFPLTTVLQDRVMPQAPVFAAGVPWSQARIDGLQVWFTATPKSGTIPQITVSKASVAVTTASVPTVAVAATPAQDTSRPVVSWTHTDQTPATVTTKARTGGATNTITTSPAHGFTTGQTVTVAIGDDTFDGVHTITATTSTTFTYTLTGANVIATAATGTAWIGDSKPQVKYRVRVFTAAQYGAGGFTPATSTATWDSGVTISDDTSRQIVTDLPTGTYRAYVQTTSQTAGIDIPSAWAYDQFTVDYTDPPAPTVTATWNTGTQAVDITATGHGNLMTRDQGTAEIALGTWTTTNCAVARSATVGGASGGFATRMTATTGADMSITSDDRPVTTGRLYAAQVRPYLTVNRSVRVDLQWRNSGGSVISTTTGTPTAVTSGSWAAAVRVSGTAPAAAVSCRLVITVLSAAAAEVAYCDCAGLSPTVTGYDPPWGPGGFTGWRILLQRSNDAGATWTQVRATTYPTQSADLGVADTDQIVVVADAEAPRSATVRYRARLTAGSPLVLVSPTSTPVVVSTGNDATWWVKAVTAPALNRGSVAVLEKPTQTVAEQAAVFTVLGRDRPIVVAGEILGDDGALTVTTTTASEHTAVTALLRHQGVLLLQSPFTDPTGVGLQWFIRLTGNREAVLDGTPTSPRRTITVSYVDVGAPTVGI